MIVADRDTIRLNVDLCWIDALAILAPAPSQNAARDLAALCSGELLEKLKAAGSLHPDTSAEDYARFLATMVSGGFLELV